MSWFHNGITCATHIFKFCIIEGATEKLSIIQSAICWWNRYTYIPTMRPGDCKSEITSTLMRTSWTNMLNRRLRTRFIWSSYGHWTRSRMKDWITGFSHCMLIVLFLWYNNGSHDNALVVFAFYFNHHSRIKDNILWFYCSISVRLKIVRPTAIGLFITHSFLVKYTITMFAYKKK